MSSAEDILAQALSDTEFEEMNISMVSANVPNISDTSVIIVDYNTRTINIPETIKYLGVESDDDVIDLNFAIPRYFNDIDLSEFTVHINYLNAKNEGDVYTADDLVVDDDNITFSWTVGRYALAFDGDVCFNVCLKKWDAVDPTIVIQELNTMVATLPVLPGLETSEAVVQEHADVLAAWEAKLFGMGDTLEQRLARTTTEQQAVIVNTSKQQQAVIIKTAEEQCKTTSATIDQRVEIGIKTYLDANPSVVFTNEEIDTLSASLL